jgi:predicted dehydrogenase
VVVLRLRKITKLEFTKFEAPMIRFGIAGFGAHAVKRVMPAFAQVQHCKVTALSRRSMADAEASARQYGIAHAFDSVEALCASPDVDAVFVTTPDSMHLQDTLTALSHGKPVLCEKPMAMNAIQARQMVDAAKERGLLLGVAHVFRFEDSVLRMRQLVAEGAIGRPVLARAQFCYPGHRSPRKWLRNPAFSCGGPIGDVGVHCIDALRFILQDEATSVYAAARYDDPASALETSAVMTLAFRKGTLATVSVSIQSEYATPVELAGEKGAIRAHNGFTVDRPLEMVMEASEIQTCETYFNNTAYMRQFDAFARAVQGLEAYPAPGEEGLRNQLILDAAFQSARTGQTISL